MLKSLYLFLLCCALNSVSIAQISFTPQWPKGEYTFINHFNATGKYTRTQVNGYDNLERQITQYSIDTIKNDTLSTSKALYYADSTVYLDPQAKKVAIDSGAYPLATYIYSKQNGQWILNTRWKYLYEFKKGLLSKQTAISYSNSGTYTNLSFDYKYDSNLRVQSYRLLSYNSEIIKSTYDTVLYVYKYLDVNNSYVLKVGTAAKMQYHLYYFYKTPGQIQSIYDTVYNSPNVDVINYQLEYSSEGLKSIVYKSKSLGDNYFRGYDSSVFVRSTHLVANTDGHFNNKVDVALSCSATDQVIFLHKPHDLSIYELQLYSILGKVVYSNSSGGNSFFIGSLPEGVYAAKITSNKGVVMKSVYIRN